MHGNKVLIIGLQGIHVYCAVCIYNVHVYWLGLTLMLSPKYALLWNPFSIVSSLVQAWQTNTPGSNWKFESRKQTKFWMFICLLVSVDFYRNIFNLRKLQFNNLSDQCVCLCVCATFEILLFNSSVSAQISCSNQT